MNTAKRNYLIRLAQAFILVAAASAGTWNAMYDGNAKFVNTLFGG